MIKEVDIKLSKLKKVKIPEELTKICLKWAKGDTHHGEFDKKGIKRMILGSWQLRRFLKIKKGKNVLEVGPFFNPQITPTTNPTNPIVWWENEREVINYLTKKYGERYRPIYVDLNRLRQSLNKLEKDTQDKLITQIKKSKDIKFDIVIASQVLNYVNFRNFLYIIKRFIKKNGIIYINNVANYGLPKFFSPNGPKTNDELLEAIEEHGFKIIKIVKLPKPRPKDNYRIIVIAKVK